MTHYRIKIEGRVDRVRGVHEVSRRDRVVCLRGNEFIVPATALDSLAKLGVVYAVLHEDNPGDAIRAVRDTPAPIL